MSTSLLNIWRFSRTTLKCILKKPQLISISTHFHWLSFGKRMWNRGTRVSDFHRGFRFNDSHYENSFYRALKPSKLWEKHIRKWVFIVSLFLALKIAKLFGLFPIDIDSRNPQNICFKWRSPRTLFSLIFVIGSGLTALSVLKYQINEGPLTPRNIIGVVFFASCSIACVLFFKIAQKFNVFMIKWMTVESCFATHDYELPSTVTSLHKRVLITTILYLLASLLEHLLYFSSETNNLIFALNFCKLTDYNFIELLITKHLNFLFANISYNFLLGLFLEYLNVSYTFFWNFLDLFIILASIGLSFLFEKLNSRVQRCQGLIMSDSVWAEIRCHYIKVHELLRYVNSLMGQMFIFGCFVDGYFILLQLLNITT